MSVVMATSVIIWSSAFTRSRSDVHLCGRSEFRMVFLLGNVYFRSRALKKPSKFSIFDYGQWLNVQCNHFNQKPIELISFS